MSDGLTTVCGKVCQTDPELRFTATGSAVCEFSVRIPGKRAKDGKPAVDARFVNVTAWKELAEYVAESLRVGDPVVVVGTEKTDTWQNKEGKTITKDKLVAWHVGVDLIWGPAERDRTDRRSTVTEVKDF